MTIRILLAVAFVVGLAGCAAPAWVTAASVAAIAGVGTAALTLDTEALKVYDNQHPAEKTP